jgi:hypothetical protein
LFIIDPRDLNGSATISQLYDRLISLGKKVGFANTVTGSAAPLQMLCGKSNAVKMPAQ